MITSSMSDTEILSEILADFQTVIRVSDYRDNKWRRRVLKETKFPIFDCHPYTSLKKNRWLILLEAQTRNDHGDRTRISFVCLRDSHEGMYAYMLITFITSDMAKGNQIEKAEELERLRRGIHSY